MAQREAEAVGEKIVKDQFGFFLFANIAISIEKLVGYSACG
jgi:hypothetical protein